MKYMCPVCGYLMSKPPRDFTYCPSCGTEFGFTDSIKTYENLRKKWVANGARWWSTVRPAPPAWDSTLQLKFLFAVNGGLAGTSLPFDHGFPVLASITFGISPKRQDGFVSRNSCQSVSFACG